MLGGVRPPPPPPLPPKKIKTKKGHFMDAELVQKSLKLHNFATTNAILMKPTTNIYYNKIFHLAKSWGVTHRA